MKKKFLLVFLLLLCFSMLYNFCISAVNDIALNWYCVRSKDHKQPIADANMQFIEQYNGYYIDHFHNDDCEEKVVYLTFDAGYENGNVEKTLNVLKQENVTGAFFILGHLIKNNTALVQRMANEGHTVCNHTFRHKDMTNINSIDAFKEELESLERLYHESTGCEMAKYYRPPEGKFNEKSLEYASQLGYKTIFWSFAYADWDNNKQPALDVAKSKILDHVHNGAVILLHPTSQTNAMILGDVIRELKKQGYRFGSLDELTAMS